MASQQFPPQKQETQPGKEHAMDPRPEAIIQNYKPANKLKVSCNLFFSVHVAVKIESSAHAVVRRCRTRWRS